MGKKVKAMPSQKYLDECFSYDGHVGTLTWKPRPLEHFKSLEEMKAWNAEYAYKDALKRRGVHMEGVANRGVFVDVFIDGDYFKANRVITKLVHGKEFKTVKFKNRNPHDLTWNNLVPEGIAGAQDLVPSKQIRVPRVKDNNAPVVRDARTGKYMARAIIPAFDIKLCDTVEQAEQLAKQSTEYIVNKINNMLKGN